MEGSIGIFREKKLLGPPLFLSFPFDNIISDTQKFLV